MNLNRLKTGVLGTALTLLCCFTPVLALLLGVLGLSALVGWIPYVVMPALVFFVALTLYALIDKKKRTTLTTSA